MTRKVKGILLKIGSTVHEEKVLTVLTDQMGCISVFAKTGKKKQYDQFYYGEWVLYETASGNYLLNSFSLEEPFHPLKDRMEHTFLASYFAQLVLHFGKGEGSEVSGLLPLLLNGLYLLGKNRPTLLVKASFEMKVMQMMGYCPSLAPCAHTGAHFSLEDGAVLCDGCALPRKTVPISPTVVAALTHILNHPPAKAYSFSIPQEEQVLLSKLTEAYLLYQLELRPSALEMFKTMYEG